ncbi:MAG: hypothetical protein Q8O13_04325 [Candidatus Omnitrophota bacterium]|nr:hypothetical protein [Candidatus Omnitrophota bacterium]
MVNNFKNEDIKKGFRFGSLCISQANKLKKNFPDISNLLYYCAVEAVSNSLAFIKKTSRIKNANFKIKYDIERKINKTKEFVNFIDKYCIDSIKKEVKFQKEENNQIIDLEFRDFLRYLYQRNRCLMVHKGLFRNFKQCIDLFVDGKNNVCNIMFTIDKHNNFTEWFSKAVKSCFQNFLKEC